MTLTPSEMHSAIAGQATLADKIRALAAAGCSRAEIARFLDRRYQHVRQVLVQDEVRANARAQALAIGEGPPAIRAGGDAPADRNGVFRLRVENDMLLLPADVRAMMGVKSGQILIGEYKDGRLVVMNGATAMRRAQEMVQAGISGGPSLSDELISDRRREAEADRVHG